jgi:hypothetical protein
MKTQIFFTSIIGAIFLIVSFNPLSASARLILIQSIPAESLVFAQSIPARDKPRIEDGNLNEGWIHIDARHVTGNHPTKGAGDLFPAGTNRAELTNVSESVVLKGTLISDLSARIKTYEDRIKVQGKILRVSVVVDSKDKNRVITMFPVLR